VLVSAALSEKGAPWEIMCRWMAGGFDLIVSSRLLYELKTVLVRERFRRYLPYEEAVEYVSWLHHRAKVLEEPVEDSVLGATPAPDDDYLVSGDDHLHGLPGRAVSEGEGGVLAHVLTLRECLQDLDRFS
jgi:predicted nucleic acid-binding protein